MAVRSMTGRRPPIAGWLSSYRRSWWPADLVAGLTAAAVVIPQAMAYAALAGLPLQVGLYTALVPMGVYALLGTSRPLSVSATLTIAILTAAALADAAPAGGSVALMTSAATLAVLVGALLVLAAVLRLGVAANLISAPVLTGFKAGVGIVIFVSQLGKVLGIEVAHGPFLATAAALLAGLGGFDPSTLAVGAAMLAILIGLPRLLPRVSAPLVAVVAGIGASAALNLAAHGVSLVGRLPSGLPAISAPDWSLVGALLPSAIGIALMAFVESVAAARAFQKHGEPEIDANRELLALGMANLGGGFFQAMPAGGGTSQTAVNDGAGARSQAAEIVTAATVIVTLLFLARLIGLLPEATLGALVLVAAAGLVSVKEFRAIGQVATRELIWAFVALAGVVILGTLDGILVAIAVTVVNLVYAANHPPVYEVGRKPGTEIYRDRAEHPDDETVPGLLMLRTEGRLNFASAPRALEKMRALVLERRPKVVILECSAIPDFEYTALKQLQDAQEKLRGAGIELWMVRLNPQPLRTVRRAPLGAAVGGERMFLDLRTAVRAYSERFGTRAASASALQ